MRATWGEEKHKTGLHKADTNLFSLPKKCCGEIWGEKKF